MISYCKPNQFETMLCQVIAAATRGENTYPALEAHGAGKLQCLPLTT